MLRNIGPVLHSVASTSQGHIQLVHADRLKPFPKDDAPFWVRDKIMALNEEAEAAVDDADVNSVDEMEEDEVGASNNDDNSVQEEAQLKTQNRRRKTKRRKQATKERDSSSAPLTTTRSNRKVRPPRRYLP